MPNSMMSTMVNAPLALVQGAGQNAREVQSAVQRAVEEAMQGAEAGLREARIAQARATLADPATIQALEGQIAAERAAIDRLTGQLTSGTTKAAENAITDQIESAQERLSSLQRQLDRASGLQGVAEEQTPPPLPPRDPDMIPREAVEIVQMFFITVAVIAIGIPLARAFGRWLDRRGTVQVATKPADFDPRFDRLEQAIEAIAIEVERVSEGQRFTNKLMSEARALPAPNAMEQWPPAGAKEPVPVERRGDR